MVINYIYASIVSSFTGLYLFFWIIGVINFLKKRDLESFKLSGLMFCALALASGPVLIYSTEALSTRLTLYNYMALMNYGAILLYIDIITKRFKLSGWILTLLKIGLCFIVIAIIGSLTACFLDRQDLIFIFSDQLPNNLFLIHAFEGAKLSPVVRPISLFGTILTILVNLWLLYRFYKQRLKGAEFLIMAGIIVSLFAKANDFIMTSGIGYYLIPLGFLSYFFEIVYFQLNLADSNS